MDKKEWFIDSHNGNIKDVYHFIQKIASGGFGVVYLAEHRKTGKLFLQQTLYLSNIRFLLKIGEKFAIKAIQKKKVKDYMTF